MTRPTRGLALAAGLTLALALAAPSLASAQTHAATGAVHAQRIAADNLRGGAVSHAVTPSATPQSKDAFPSANSTVIASIGFIDDYEVGYFWSASRGDSVEQTFTGPAKIKKATFKLDVTDNGLANGAEVDWTASINGTDIGSFVVPEGETGPITEKFKFSKMTGGTYDVKIYVTNEVPAGDGAIALAYAEDYAHSVNLKR